MIAERLRELLDSYYAGTISPAEEDCLRDYFVHASDLPEEFRVDACMFRAMADESATRVPLDLEDRILAMTVCRSHPESMSRFLPWVGIAASLVVLLALGWWLTDSYKIYESSNEMDEMSLSIPSPELADTSMVLAQSPSITLPGPGHGEHEERPADENYVEITDPVEAAGIIEEIFGMITEQMASTEKGVRKVEMAIAMISDPMDVLEIKSQYE